MDNPAYTDSKDCCKAEVTPEEYYTQITNQNVMFVTHVHVFIIVMIKRMLFLLLACIRFYIIIISLKALIFMYTFL